MNDSFAIDIRISFVQHPRHQQVLVGDSFSLECNTLLIDPSTGLTQGSLILYLFHLNTSAGESYTIDVFVYPTNQGFPYRTVSNVSIVDDGSMFYCEVVAIVPDVEGTDSSFAQLTVHSELMYA